MAKIKLDRNTEVTSRLNFKPLPQFNNICIGYLDSVSLEESQAKEDSNWEYAGMEVPRLVFTFKQHKISKTDPDRFHTHSELPIANINSKGEAIEDNNLITMYTAMLSRIKHIHDAFSDAPNFKPMNFDPEFDTDASIEERLEQFKKVFGQFVKLFNEGKDKNPIYNDSYMLAMKLVASGQKRSYLAFPTFVGKGFIQHAEIRGGKLITTLEFRPSETVELGISAPSAVPEAMGQVNTTGIPDDVMKSILEQSK